MSFDIDEAIDVLNLRKKSLTNAEKKLFDCGFSLLNESQIIVDKNISYPVLKYARFTDDDMTMYDMTIEFNVSQNSIELWDNKSKNVFIDSHIMSAIYFRAQELGF